MPVWKTCMDLCLNFPILIFFSIVCSSCNQYKNTWFEGYQVFRGILICTAMVLLIMFISNRTIIKLYRWFIYGVGILCIFGGIALSTVNNGDRVLQNGPFSSEEIKLTSFEDLFDVSLFEMGRFISNVMIILLILGVNSWTELEEDEKDEHEDDFFTRNFKKFSNFVFDCLLISVLLSFATVFPTFMIKMIRPDIALYKFDVFGFEIIIERIIWTLMFIGVSTIGFYKIYWYYRKRYCVEKGYPEFCVLHI